MATVVAKLLLARVLARAAVALPSARMWNVVDDISGGSLSGVRRRSWVEPSNSGPCWSEGCVTEGSPWRRGKYKVVFAGLGARGVGLTARLEALGIGASRHVRNLGVDFSSAHGA